MQLSNTIATFLLLLLCSLTANVLPGNAAFVDQQQQPVAKHSTAGAVPRYNLRPRTRCPCGKHALSEMKTMDIAYSVKGHMVVNGRKHEVKKTAHVQFFADKALGEGTFGRVYHGFSSDMLDFHGNQVSGCVALKVLKNDGASDEEFLNEVRILRAFNKLQDRYREGVIKLIQFGTSESIVLKPDESGQVYVMELGNGDLWNYLDKKAPKLRTNEKVQEVATNIVAAINDFHRLAMHLDLKPGNMMMVKDKLKVIDFGSSKLIRKLKEAANLRNTSAENKMANSCRRKNHQVTTALYRPPENSIQCYSESWESVESPPEVQLSTKNDIWSVGIMILEVILCSPTIDQQFFHALHGANFNNIWSWIKELDYLYKMSKDRWIRRLERSYSKAEIPFSGDSSYAAYVLLLLQIRHQHPKLFNLVTAALEYEYRERPSAKGMAQYLKGKCRLRSEIQKDDKKGTKEEEMPIWIDEQTKGIILMNFASWKNQLNDALANSGKMHLQEEEKQLRIERLKQLKALKNLSSWVEPLLANVNGQNSVDLRRLSVDESDGKWLKSLEAKNTECDMEHTKRLRIGPPGEEEEEKVEEEQKEEGHNNDWHTVEIVDGEDNV